MTRISNKRAQELGLSSTQKTSKYRSRKVTVDDIVFDSKKEALKYEELKLLKRAGEITEFELQPKFVLQEGFRHKGKAIRPITYTADFKITYPDGRIVILDTKGVRTQQYVLRKKMLLYKYRDEIEFVEE